MGELYGRKWELRIADLILKSDENDQSKNAHIEFDIEKTDTRDPNKAKISVYMLSPTNREKIVSSRNLDVTLSVGYRDLDISQIFNGNLRNAENKWDRRTVITTVEGDDGGITYRNSVVSRAFGPGTSVLDVLKEAVKALDIGQGNLAEITSLSLQNGQSVYQSGTALNGRARNEVERIVRSCGYRWSIQDGVFQLRQARKPIIGTAVVLKSGTGLVGTPRKSEQSDNKPPIVEADSMILPGLYPGRIVVLTSEEISGNYRIANVRFQGSSSGQWLAKLQMKEY